MDYYFKEIDNYIMKIQILNYPKEIQDKIEYFLQDGKRLRPILCIIFSGIDNNIKEDTYIFKEENTKIIYDIASFIEQIHCLSLVLDDLPEMDNDFMRRGKTSFHSKYSTDYTNFFIYYIFNNLCLSLNTTIDTILDNALEYNISNNKTLNNNINISKRINKLLSDNLNILLDGQYIDLQSSFLEKQDLEKQDLENPARKHNEKSRTKNDEDNTAEARVLDGLNPSLEARVLEGLKPSDEIKIIFNLLEKNKLLEENVNIIAIINNIELNMKKTSSLFNMSICSGFLLQLWLKKYNLDNYNNIYNKLSIWSNILGYMFQISDDILDMDEDKIKDNPNICQIISRESTCKLLIKGCSWLSINIKKIILESNINIYNTNIYNNIHFNLDAINNIIEKIIKRIES